MTIVRARVPEVVAVLLLVLCCCCCCSCAVVGAFTVGGTTGRTASSSLWAARGDAARRARILSPPGSARTARGDGNHFTLDRFGGKISFGYTTQLVTTLSKAPAASSLRDWLSDARRVAFAIWDEDLIDELPGGRTYKLRLMDLRFVTISLKPEVDVLMWTEPAAAASDKKEDTFFIESVDFDPKLQLLPGVRLSAAALGIQIDVAGELRVSPDGRGLTGRIGFVTSGNLPPPLRILPERTLSSAAGVINQQIADFAVRSFQRGASREYAKYVKTTTTTTKTRAADNTDT